MSELLPCPFCGGEGKTFIRDWDDGTQSLWIECQSCGAEAGHCGNEQEAIEAWNTRYDPQLDAIPATEENMARFGWRRERACENMQEHGFECSECGFFDAYADETRTKYCPNCGRKVDK